MDKTSLIKKYFRLLSETSILSSESTMTEKTKNALMADLPAASAQLVECEEITEAEALSDNRYFFVSFQDYMDDGSCGERNVFYDHHGNEWYN